MDDESESYMRHAEGDLTTAEKLDGDDESDICAGAFHAQQAAEKSIKAVLAASGREPQWTHDLVGAGERSSDRVPCGCVQF